MPIRMNGHACTIYSMLSRVCDLFFPIMYDFCAVSFDNDVLILDLPSAVSTPVDDGPYFFNIANLRTMVYLSDWRECFHFISFVSVWLYISIFQWKLLSSVRQKYVFWSNNILCESRGTLDCYLSQTCIHAMLDSSLISSEGSALQCNVNY